MTETKRFWILNTLTEYSGIKDKDKLLLSEEYVNWIKENVNLNFFSKKGDLE